MYPYFIVTLQCDFWLHLAPPNKDIDKRGKPQHIGLDSSVKRALALAHLSGGCSWSFESHSSQFSLFNPQIKRRFWSLKFYKSWVLNLARFVSEKAKPFTYLCWQESVGYRCTGWRYCLQPYLRGCRARNHRWFQLLVCDLCDLEFVWQSLAGHCNCSFKIKEKRDNNFQYLQFYLESFPGVRKSAKSVQ